MLLCQIRSFVNLLGPQKLAQLAKEGRKKGHHARGLILSLSLSFCLHLKLQSPIARSPCQTFPFGKVKVSNLCGVDNLIGFLEIGTKLAALVRERHGSPVDRRRCGPVSERKGSRDGRGALASVLSSDGPARGAKPRQWCRGRPLPGWKTTFQLRWMRARASPLPLGLPPRPLLQSPRPRARPGPSGTRGAREDTGRCGR